MIAASMVKYLRWREEQLTIVRSPQFMKTWNFKITQLILNYKQILE